MDFYHHKTVTELIKQHKILVDQFNYPQSLHIANSAGVHIYPNRTILTYWQYNSHTNEKYIQKQHQFKQIRSSL